METNKEIRNDELKTAMITLKLQNDKESEKYFIEELKNAYFLIPAEKTDSNDELTFMLLCDQEGNNYFQGYTDKDEYNKWFDKDNSTEFVLTFDEYANIIISSSEEVKGLVINPFNENIILDKEFLKYAFTMDKIYIDEVTDCPKEIKNIIKKVLQTEEKVEKAYLMNIKKKNIPGYLLIVDSNTKNKKKLHDNIGKAITSSIKEINLDIVSNDEDMFVGITEGKKPFYTKK